MITRFAPSPTGPLHLGHAFSALAAYDMARAAGGQFLLRIEDIDQTRARTEWEAQIYDDLHWLGIVWPEPVMAIDTRRGLSGGSERSVPNRVSLRLRLQPTRYPCGSLGPAGRRRAAHRP